MSDWKFEEGKAIYLDYLEERKLNFIKNFDPSFIWIFVEFVLVILGTATGKPSPMSPMYTAFVPTLLGMNLSVLQLFFNLVYNRFFARGNIMLMTMQLFQFI